jgi:cytochrome c oxidase subunit I+III
VNSSASPAVDASSLETHAFGSRSPLFWGSLLLCCIEGTALAIFFTSYFYLRQNFDEWPPSALIRPAPGAVASCLLACSMVPMAMTAKVARAMDLARTRRWQALSTAIGAAALIARGWEIHALPFDWTENAYASVVWGSMGFHTIDFVAEMGEMLVLTALLFARRREAKHFEDVYVNAVFWAFLVLVWMPFAGVFYADGAAR